MIKSEITKRIERVVEHFKTLNAAWDKFHDITGSMSDSPLGNAVWKMQDQWIESVSELIGDDDDWLNWYLWANDCGHKALEAKAARWKKARKIQTVTDLVDIIWDSRIKYDCGADLKASKRRSR